MPPTHTDLVRAMLTHTLNEKGHATWDHGTHLSLVVDGRKYKIVVDRDDE